MTRSASDIYGRSQLEYSINDVLRILGGKIYHHHYLVSILRTLIRKYGHSTYRRIPKSHTIAEQ